MSEKLNARRMGSAKAVTDAAKRGVGDGVQWIKSIPTDGITVRFLMEPEDWFGYMRYWSDEASQYVPMLEGERAPDGARSQFRFVTCALDVDQDRVIPLDVPKSIVTQIMKFYSKYDTLMDRDYDLSREGEKLDTTYTIVPDSAQKRNLGKYDIIDLVGLLVSLRESAINPLGADSSPKIVSTKPATPKPIADDVDDDEDDLDDEIDDIDDGVSESDDDPDEGEAEDDDEEEVRNSKEELEKMSPTKLKELAEYWECDPIPRTRAKLVEVITDAQTEYFDGDSDEYEDDEEELDEDALASMSIRELQSLAEEYDIDHSGMKKDELIEAILESAE